MPKHFIYPIYTMILVILAFALVPRKEIRRLAIYGIFFGAVADVFFILLISVLGMGSYINYRFFGAFGIPFFPPIAWTAYYIIYLYLLPKNKPGNYLFPAVASVYSVYFSNILQGLGILKWYYGNPLLPLLIIYAPWHFGVTWAYLRINSEVVENKGNYSFVPEPAMKPEQKERKVHFVKPKKLCD